MAGAPFVVSDRYPPPPIDIVRLWMTFFRIRTCAMARWNARHDLREIASI